MQFPIPSTGNSAVNILIIRVKFWCVVGSLHHTHTHHSVVMKGEQKMAQKTGQFIK
jgi:hypothetical protein